MPDVKPRYVSFSACCWPAGHHPTGFDCQTGAGFGPIHPTYPQINNLAATPVSGVWQFVKNLDGSSACARHKSTTYVTLRTVSRPNWRRGRDSNPRRVLALAGFQDQCIQPLCHLSGRGDSPDSPAFAQPAISLINAFAPACRLLMLATRQEFPRNRSIAACGQTDPVCGA